jgi:hypothetical protein
MSINRNDMCSSKVNKMAWVYILLLAAIFLLVQGVPNVLPF